MSDHTIFSWAAKHGISTVALMGLMDLLDPTRSLPVPDTKVGSEGAVQAAIRLRAASAGIPLWRNNSGAYKDDTGRMVRYGLGNDSVKLSEHWKSSDLIGILPNEIKEADVGKVWGRFFAVEVKRPGWKAPTDDRERAQSAFLTNVRALGGVGLFAQSVEDVFGK
jgi:hypothetical protein